MMKNFQKTVRASWGDWEIKWNEDFTSCCYGQSSLTPGNFIQLILMESVIYFDYWRGKGGHYYITLKKKNPFLPLHMLNFKHFFPHLQLQHSSPSMPVVLSLSLSTLPFCFSSHCNSSLTPRLSKYLMQQLSNKTKFGQNSLFVHKYFGEFMSCAKIRAAKFLKSLLKTELTQQQLNNQTKTEPQIQTEILLIYHFNLSKMECGTSDENNLY